MNYTKVLGFLLLNLLVVSPLFAGEKRSEDLARRFLNAGAQKDWALTLQAAGGRIDMDLGVYISNEDVETFVDLFKTKGILLKELKKKESEKKEGLQGLKNLKAFMKSPGIEDHATIPDYQKYSGRTETGDIIIVASHYFDPGEKKWVKKTYVILVSLQLPQPATPTLPPAKVLPKSSDTKGLDKKVLPTQPLMKQEKRRSDRPVLKRPAPAVPHTPSPKTPSTPKELRK